MLVGPQKKTVMLAIEIRKRNRKEKIKKLFRRSVTNINN
jgi:hypothetical protein